MKGSKGLAPPRCVLSACVLRDGWAQHERHWPAATRAEAVDVALARSEWLSTGRWEALGPHTSWPDFPVVCDALTGFIAEQKSAIMEALSIAATETAARRQILQMPTV